MITSQPRHAQLLASHMHSMHAWTPVSFAHSCVESNACGDSKQYCPKRYLDGNKYVKLCKIQSRSAFGYCPKCYLGETTYIMLRKIAKLLDPLFFQRLANQQLYCSNHRCSTLDDRVAAWTAPFVQAMTLPMKSSSRLHPAYRGFSRLTLSRHTTSQ